MRLNLVTTYSSAETLCALLTTKYSKKNRNRTLENLPENIMNYSTNAAHCTHALNSIDKASFIRHGLAREVLHLGFTCCGWPSVCVNFAETSTTHIEKNSGKSSGDFKLQRST